ncbi:hypothetical protein [Glutamicibacter ardleyensis]|uniref:hypothetical protein n=1 Tax=Glutamicibacter ardleyensis TaxID=225894 RepID=UPI003FCFB1D2
MKVWRYISSGTVLGVVCVATLVSPVQASEELTESSLEQLIANHAPEDSSIAPTVLQDGQYFAEIDRTEVSVESGKDANIEISDSTGSALLKPLPDKVLSVGKASQNGSVHYEVEDGTRLITQPLKDASVRLSVAIADSSQPTEFSYDLIPDGGSAEIVEGHVLIQDANEEIYGTVAAPWAVDSQGRQVETSYEIRGNLLIQKVEHTHANAYPVIADPLFKRGVISKVLKEQWSSKGGYEISFKVSLQARYWWTRVSNWDKIYKKGLEDLQEHYPRSMNKATMHQQWRCHVYGLPATFTIDLEGWRKSKPNWVSTEIPAAIKAAVKKKDPKAVSRACNW